MQQGNSKFYETVSRCTERLICGFQSGSCKFWLSCNVNVVRSVGDILAGGKGCDRVTLISAKELSFSPFYYQTWSFIF